MNKIFATLLASAMASGATAATYVSSRTVGTATTNLSVTTDNTIGTLTSDNILDWSISLTTVAGSATLLGPNSGDTSRLLIRGTAFSATSTDLFFNFSAPEEAFVLFQSTVGDRSLYCVQTVNCFDQTRGEEIISVGPLFNDFERGTRVGSISLASTELGLVPEPAAWSMMIGGLGIVGGSLRARRRQEVRVKFG